MKQSISKMQVVSVILVVLVVLFIVYSVFIAEPLGTSEERATYIAGDNMQQQWFAYDETEGVFYYTDQFNKHYIKGTVKKQEDGIYFLSCNQAKNKTILPDQEIIVKKDKLFPRKKELTLLVSGEEILFKKSEDIVALLGDVQYE